MCVLTHHSIRQLIVSEDHFAGFNVKRHPSRIQLAAWAIPAEPLAPHYEKNLSVLSRSPEILHSKLKLTWKLETPIYASHRY